MPVAMPVNGTGAIVTDAEPLFPSLVAVMVIGPPTTTPVTSPLPETLAIPLLPDDQVTVRPLRTLLLASRVTAVSCRVAPTVTLGELGLTVTEATGTGMMVTDAVPLLPSLVAVIVTGPPTRSPDTSPPLDTLAVAELLEDQLTERPVKELPSASSVVALS